MLVRDRALGLVIVFGACRWRPLPLQSFQRKGEAPQAPLIPLEIKIESYAVDAPDATHGLITSRGIQRVPVIPPDRSWNIPCGVPIRSEENKSDLKTLMRTSYAY